MESIQTELPQIGTLPITAEIEARAVDVKQVYAIEIVGDCMAPAFRHNDIAVVCPLSRPAAGDNVVIWPEGAEQPLLKQLVLWVTSGDIEPVIIVEQFEPPERLYFEPSKVRAVHKVIGKAEGGAS